MDYHQRNGDDDYSVLTFSQPLNSLSLTSSTTSILNSASKTTSLIIPKQSNINIDRSMTQTQSLRKRRYQQRISSHSTTSTTNASLSTTILTERNEKSLKKYSKIQRQEARPLGTCVRKCDQCRQLKHILLVECTICFRMMDIDLKDCKCQMLRSQNIIDHFICSICNCELTLDGYIICANRTCQTTLSALINKENINESQEKSILSTNLTNICYPKSAHRTVAVQINTLLNLPSLQRFLPTIIDEDNEESSLLSWSKHDVNWAIITSSNSSNTSHLSIDSGVDESLKNIARNMTAGFNSNQPTKLALQSEDELQQQHSQTPNPTSTNNTVEISEMPTSPRCLAIMSVRKRHDRLSTLLMLQTNKTCQTQLSCLTNINEMIKSEELPNTTIIQTKNPTKIERQIQVDTIKDRFDDLCQVQVETADRVEKDSTKDVMNEDRILQALTDRDGQRWSAFIDQLINEQSHFSPSEVAQQLLDTIERLHTAQRLNNLTTGQLQRKIRYAMSQFKHIDEHSYLQNNLKQTKTNRSRKTTECNGRVDMAVTVRQIDNRHNRQSVVSSDQNWKPYVDRLFEQDHSAEEIQRLLREAAETTMQSDDQRLQDVFNYIDTKAKHQREKTAPSGIAFVGTPTKTKSVTRPPPSVSERKMMSHESSSIFSKKEQSVKMEAIKNKPRSSLIKSPIVKSDIIDIKSSEKTSIIDLNKDEKERNLSLHSTIMVANPSATITYKHPSIISTEITIQKESSTDKKSDSDDLVVTLKQNASQIQEVVEPKISQSDEASNFHNLKNFSTTDKLLPNLEEQTMHALRRVQNTLDAIDNIDSRLHPHSSNTQIELNRLIDILESNLQKSNNINPDNIESLMTQCIKLLNKEKKIIVPQLEEIDFQNLNEEISNTVNLLQEYKKTIIPSTANNQDSSFNRHISDMVMISSDPPISFKQVEANVEQTIQSQSPPAQLPSNTILDSKEKIMTSEYQETAGLIRCRPIPYTSSNEKRSTETLKQVLISSTEHISSKTKELDEKLIAKQSDPNHVSDIPSKTENKLHNDQSQIKWLNSLLSKISDNVRSTSSISSVSPSLSVLDQTKVDHNEKQEPIIMKSIDKQVSSSSDPSKLSLPVHQHSRDAHNVIDVSQNTPYETDVIILKEEHMVSMVVPDRVFSISDEPFQVTQIKLQQKKTTSSLKQVSKSEDPLKSWQTEENNEKNIKESSTLNLDSDHTSRKTPSATTLDANNFDEKKQSTSSLANDESQSKTPRSSSPSDIDLSDQLDQHQGHEDITSPEQLRIVSASTSEEDTSPILAPEDTPLSKTDIDTVPKSRTKSSSSKNHKEENENPNSMKTSDSFHINMQASDEHKTIASTKTFNLKDDINKLQLPVSTQQLSISNAIQSNSFLTHLHNQNDTVSSKESISSDNPTLYGQKHLSSKKSSIDSEDQSIVATPIDSNDDKRSSNEKIDDSMIEEFYTPNILSPNYSNLQQSPNTVLSPSRTAKFENAKYKKLTMPLSSSFLATSSPTNKITKEDELNFKRDSAPYVLVDKPSGSTTPTIKPITTTDDNNDDRNSKKSISSVHDAPIDDTPKEDLTYKLDRNSDKVQNEPKSPVLSNASVQQMSSSASDDTQMNLKPQLETEIQSVSEDTNSSNASSSDTLDEENQLNKMPIKSTVEEKSSVDKNTTPSELFTNTNDKSEDSSSIYSSFPPEQSRQDEDYQSEKKKLLKSESLIKQVRSFSDKQSTVDDYSNTKNVPDETSNINQVDASSPVIVKKRPIMSTTTAVLPSSITNVNSQQQDLKSGIFLSESRNDKLTSEENQGPVSVSSFNLSHLIDIPSGIRAETEGEKLLSQLGKHSSNDLPHPIKSKHESSLSNSLIRNNMPSSPIPKLLPKRSSIKQTSTTAQSIKPSATLSITDVSTSSTNTVVTDHFPSTHSTISDQEAIISLKKSNKRNNPKNEFMANSDSLSKYNILKKPSQNQKLISSNKKERSFDASKKKFIHNSLLTNSELVYDTEPGSDVWMKSHEDTSQILIIDEPDEKKQNKNRMRDGSRLMPFNLKARGDHQAYTIDSSKLPSIEQSSVEHHIKKWSNDPSRRPIIRLPVTQIEKFPCGTIGPRPHPSSIAHQLFNLPSIHNHQQLASQINQTTESLTDRFYSLMSSETNDDKQAFDSIVNWQQQYQLPKNEQNKFQYMYLLDTSTGNTVRGKQYPILTDEIDMIDDPNACTIVNKWAFADLVNAERQKFIQESTDNINKPKKQSKLNKNIKICLLKRPLTEFEENIFKEVDIISIADSQTLLLHIPSITVDNQVFIKNRKFKCDQTFDQNSQINTIYHSTLSPLLDMSINGSKCLCLIGGGKYSGKTYLLRSLIDLLSFDLTRLLSTYDIYIKLLGICHNRIVDLLQNYSPIRLIKSMNWSLIPNDEFHLQNTNDIDYITCQIKKRRRFIHQLIQINFLDKDKTTIIGSLMIVILASSQYVYTRNLCSHRKKFLINSLNRTMLAFKRALLGIRQNPDRVRAAFNNDILTRLIQPYVFHNRSNICYIGTLNPGHRHRTATKSTLEFARNLRFCLKRINKQRRKREKLSQMNSNHDDIF